MARSKCFRFVGAIVFFATVLHASVCKACATAYEYVPSPQDYVASEQAVIIWDERHHMEHFIRQANLHTDSTTMGFLVPTPSQPDLAQANVSLFSLAQAMGTGQTNPISYRTPWSMIAPVVTNPLLHLGGLSNIFGPFSTSNPEATNSTVLGETLVADYHVTILDAADEAEVFRWLNANGYFLTPELRAWLNRYAQAHWAITAFKLIKPEGRTAITTSAIRLSFKTDKPFYPYSEPSDRQMTNAASPQGRALSVTILSDQRMTGSLADHSVWPGHVEYAGNSTPPPYFAGGKTGWNRESWAHLAALNLTTEQGEIPPVVTILIDESNPRPGTADLYFSPDQDQGSYSGTIVNVDLPTNFRFVIENPLKDAAALLLVVLLPAIPIYCGWQVLRAVPPVGNACLNVTPPKPWAFAAIHRGIGLLAVLLGLFYGLQFAVILSEQIISPFLGWANSDSRWLWTSIPLILAALPIAAMVWGIIFCGVSVSNAQTARSGMFSVKGVRQGFCSASALLAGAVLFLALVEVIVPAL